MHDAHVAALVNRTKLGKQTDCCKAQPLGPKERMFLLEINVRGVRL